MLDTLNIYELAFVGYTGFAFVVTAVGVVMLRHYAKKEAG